MQETDRTRELDGLLKDPKTRRLVQEMIKLEATLDKLAPEKIPHYRVNPKNPEQMKITPAFYAYHKTLSTYKEIVRVLIKSTQGDDEEISPLRRYLDSLGKKGGGV